MAKNLKIFLIVFLLSFPFWWGMNILEKNLKDFFFWQEMAKNPRLLLAQANQLKFENRIRSLKPLRDKKMENLKIKGESAISVFLDKNGGERILFEKNPQEKRPIASLTKLMTALIVLENYDLSKKIKISPEAINQRENLGKLTAGKIFEAKYLLYPLLMESSNDAAFSLANDYEEMSEEKFLKLMNAKAEELELENTYFYNCTGLDPEEAEKEEIKEEERKKVSEEKKSSAENLLTEGVNYSTASDLVKLVKELLKKPLIWEILSKEKFNSYGSELVNTNRLLGEMPGIIGGKTGYTEKALGCFLLVKEAPKSKGYLINIILGSPDRFGEMKKLIKWLQEAYQW